MLGNNGILLKLSQSKSKKRIIQAKNIQFKTDDPGAARFKSLSPDSHRLLSNQNEEPKKDYQDNVSSISIAKRFK